MERVVKSEDSELSQDCTNGAQSSKHGNILPVYCNERTMSLNPLIHTNIIQSPYFKSLYELKTYHEVIDEIYNKVQHLEPWERGSRRPESGNRSVSVRGVAAGGIVSSAFCLLYKLFTLKLTKKQLHGLLKHQDSPYIRGLGFLYIRYTMPPKDFWEWFKTYLEDQEKIDLKAGGGQVTKIGEMCRHLLTKLDWFTTLFPRIPVPMQKEIERHLEDYDEQHHRETTKVSEQPNHKRYDDNYKKNHHSSQDHRHRHDNERHRSTSENSRHAYRDGSPRNRSDDSHRGHHDRDGLRGKTSDHSRDRKYDHHDRRTDGSGDSWRHRNSHHDNDRRHHEQQGHYSRNHHHESSRHSSRAYRSHRSRSRSPRDRR